MEAPRRNSSLVARVIAPVSIVAATHFAVWFFLFRSAFAAIDAGRSFPIVPGLALNILGAPLMFLLLLPPASVSPTTRWWGDDANLVVGLGALNSLLWGCIVVWAYRFVRRRRETPPDAT